MNKKSTNATLRVLQSYQERKKETGRTRKMRRLAGIKEDDVLGTIMRKCLKGTQAVIAITIAMVAVIAGIRLGPPEQAMAATIQKDGFEAVGPYSIFLDIEKISMDNLTCDMPNDWHTKHIDSHTSFYVDMTNSYLGKTQSWSTLTLRFNKAATDAYGNELDMIMTMKPTITLGTFNPIFVNDDHATLHLSIMRIGDGGGMVYDAHAIDLTTNAYMNEQDPNEFRSPGTKIDTTVRFVQTGTNNLVNGSCIMYFEDVDQPDANTFNAASYDTDFVEGITLGSGMNKTVHTLSNTTLVAIGDDIRGTRATDYDEQEQSAFVTKCDPEFQFTWHASLAASALFKEVEFPSGNLTVRKQVSSSASETAPSFSFNVSFSGTYAPDPISFTLTNGQSFTIPKIPAGVTATVTETTPSEYTATWSPSNSVQIADGSNNTITCTNTRRTGNIHIKKTAIGTDGGTAGIASNATWPFTVTIYDKSNAVWRTESFNLSPNGERNINNIPSGYRYVVNETSGSLYDLSWSNKEGTVGAGTTTNVTATNTRRYGKLDVKKIAVGTDGANAGVRADARWQFNVKIYDENHALWKNENFTLAKNEVKSFEKVPTTYTYAVTETADTLYDTSIANATGTIGHNTTSTATATNTRRYGRLDVKKIAIGTDGASAGVRADAKWQFNVKIYDDYGNVWKNETFWLARNQVKSFEKVPTTYTYAVTETADALYDTTIANATGTIAHNTTSTATATNTRRYGKLDVKKIAHGTDENDSGLRADAKWQFNVKVYDDYGNVWKNETFWLARNQVKSFEKIPTTYTYQVTETADVLYDTTITNATGTIAHNTTSTATATNNRRYGRLDVKKLAVGTDGASAGIRADARWQFNVKIYDDDGNMWKNETFWLARNEVKSFERIPTTYTYQVTETPNILYDTGITNPSGTIQHNVTSTATATNTRRYGNLRVRKVANGTDANDSGLRSDARWHFNVVIRDDYGNVWKNESFWLTRNEERVIERIPTTYTYTVTEDADELYDTSIDNATNYIRHNDTQTATATNNRRYGQLEVKKTAQGTDVADSGIRPDERWEFRVMILDDDGHAWKDETFWLTRNETKLFERIPTTYTYRVFESEHPLYDSSSTGEAGVIANRETSKANFENQRRHGRLEVRKKANGTNASDSGIETDAKWRFDVTIRDDYGNTWKHASFLLARDEVRAFEDIPTTYTYEVSESADSQYETTWNDRTGMIEKNTTSSCVATNRRLEGSFVVRKVVDRSRITDKTLDAGRAFEIRVSLNDDKRRPVSGTYGEMTFVNGECVLRLKDGEARVATDVPTDWTWGVREIAPDQYTLSGIENRTGAVEDNKRTQVVVTNEQLPGGALVNKVTK